MSLYHTAHSSLPQYRTAHRKRVGQYTLLPYSIAITELGVDAFPCASVLSPTSVPHSASTHCSAPYATSVPHTAHPRTPCQYRTSRSRRLGR
eukprot:528337-Rhodomonas_salina.2